MLKGAALSPSKGKRCPERKLSASLTGQR
jgi:hypothetical protein